MSAAAWRRRTRSPRRSTRIVAGRFDSNGYRRLSHASMQDWGDSTLNDNAPPDYTDSQDSQIHDGMPAFTLPHTSSLLLLPPVGYTQIRLAALVWETSGDICIVSSSRTLFLCASLNFTRHEVLLAAERWGVLSSLRAESHCGLACLAMANAHGHAIESAELQAASEAFRRRHGLRSGAATRTWMAQWDVPSAAFGDYLERELAKRAFRTKLVDPGKMDDEIDSILWSEALFSGLAEPWCAALAARAAVAAASDSPLRMDSTWPERLEALDAQYEQFTASVVTPERMQAALESGWRDYFAFDCEFAHFATESAAQEARFCVEQDGEVLATVCAEAGGNFRCAHMILSALPAPLRACALSAPTGGLLAAVVLEGEHVLCRIVTKHAPSLDDPDTQSRLREILVHEAVRPLVTEHVVWADEEPQ